MLNKGCRQLASIPFGPRKKTLALGRARVWVQPRLNQAS